MKHVPKSNEPPKLNEYRQNNPDRHWDHFRSECQSGLDEVFETLSKDHGGLCAYCEMKINKPNHQVEHFHDKSDESDPNNPTRWHLDWSNMWYCCKGGTQESSDKNKFLQPVKDNRSCGQHKELNDYQNIIPPNEIPAFPRIFSYKITENSVEIQADENLCTESGIDKNRVEQTIKILNLNCKRLQNARYAHLKPIIDILTKTKPNPEKLKGL
ncbi:MAG: TIGR02646 family protein, partial [Planctomycetaceae bacterium]|nr:TIGR02646 family protein [Planctomycetaceae bacterium]